MSTAFVLGNGRSRLALDLDSLKTLGTTYGCNALFREFAPDVLISTDKPISAHIQESGYSLNHKMFTRKPMPGSGAKRVPQDYFGFSSGPIAVGVAALDGHSKIYMIGFDMGPLPGDKFNNVYADTEFYKKSSARPTYTGNWIKQIKRIAGQFRNTDFIRVMGDCTAEIEEFREQSNIKKLGMPEFLDRINKQKDL